MMKDGTLAGSASPPEGAMTCRELFERLSEFLDGELSQELCEEIRRHLDGCDPCVNFVKTLRTTTELCHRLPSRPIPLEVAEELRSFLRAHLPPRKER
jgi:anti-sigma factor (TIGR02949 family)